MSPAPFPKSTTPYAAAAIMVLLLVATPRAKAEHWATPDGNFGFDLPSDGTWVAQPNPPAPATALWTAADETKNLLVAIVPNPTGGAIEMSGLKAGTLRGLPPGCTISSSRQSSLNGVPIYLITAKGTVNGRAFSAKQCIVPLGASVYKVMVGAIGEVEADRDISAVFNSLTVNASAYSARPSGPRPRDPHALSVLIGEVAFTVLAAAGILSVIRRATRKEPPAGK